MRASCLPIILCLIFPVRLTVVMSFRPYSVYLLTAGDAELAGAGAPLPPPELYNGRRPQAGLLPLLTAALWQVLWVDAAPGAGECVLPFSNICLSLFCLDTSVFADAIYVRTCSWGRRCVRGRQWCAPAYAFAALRKSVHLHWSLCFKARMSELRRLIEQVLAGTAMARRGSGSRYLVSQANWASL